MYKHLIYRQTHSTRYAHSIYVFCVPLGRKPFTAMMMNIARFLYYGSLVRTSDRRRSMIERCVNNPTTIISRLTATTMSIALEWIVEPRWHLALQRLSLTFVFTSRSTTTLSPSSSSLFSPQPSRECCLRREFQVQLYTTTTISTILDP